MLTFEMNDSLLSSNSFLPYSSISFILNACSYIMLPMLRVVVHSPQLRYPSIFFISARDFFSSCVESPSSVSISSWTDSRVSTPPLPLAARVFLLVFSLTVFSGTIRFLISFRIGISLRAVLSIQDMDSSKKLSEQNWLKL